MFIKVVDTIVTQEQKIDEDLHNGTELEGSRLSDPHEEELSDVHGEPLRKQPGG